MTRKYIKNSSIHDYPPYYQGNLMLAAVKELIANKLIDSKTKPRLSKQFGWKNQPQILTFNALSQTDLDTIVKRLEFVTGKMGLLVFDKDW